MKKLGEFFEEYSFGTALLACILVLVIAASIVFGVICFEGWILMLLWNAVVCSLWATAPTLTFWSSVGLMLICNILFKTVHHNNSKD